MAGVKAQFIIEIMGRPPEHIKEALNTLVVKMGSEKGVNILGKKYFDPKPIEKVDNMFSAFAQIDAEFETISHFFSILMGYMPSNVEVYEPEKFKMSADEVNDLANFITSKLHRYDEIAKRAIFQRDVLVKQVQQMRSGKPMAKAPAGSVKKEKKSQKKKTAGKKPSPRKKPSARRKTAGKK